MSNRGGGGSFVTIPKNVKKTIQSIREITGKQHSDEDIYSVLQDCAMDLDDTAQKLLYLDTFHEVKRKHDRRKGAQDRGARGGRGSYSGAGGGRNAATRRENGVDCMADRNASTSSRSMQKTNNNAAIPGTKDLTATPRGPSTLSNGSSILGHSPKLPAAAGNSVLDVKKLDASSPLPAATPSAPTQISVSGMQSKEGKSTSFPNGPPTSTTPASVSGSVSSFSDPITAPSMTRNPGAAGTIKHEVGSQKKGAEQNHIQGNEKVSPIKPKATGKNQLSESLQPATLYAYDDSLVVKSSSNDSHLSEELALPLKTVLSEDAEAKVSSQSLPEPFISNGHVKFPNHYKVPEALKSGLTFGSFDTNSGPGAKCSNGIDGDINSMQAVELAHLTDETAMEPSSNDSGSTPMQVNHSDQPESPIHVLEKVSISEGNVEPSADSRAVQPKQDEMLLPEGHQSSTVQIAPNYGFGIMPTMQATHLVPIAGHETQAWDVSQTTGFVSKNSMASSTPSQQMQNSVAASPHPLLFRPPYPPNYLQYGPYFNPYFLPPMHQFLSHNGLPQQPSTGNAYLTAAPTAAGVKFPLPQFKPGTSAGSPAPIALPILYGSYGSSSTGFNPSPTVTSGSSTGNDDLSASQLKERNIYTTGPLSEISSWIPPSGQDISSLQLSSLYHLHPQGQHLTFSPQAGLAAFPGIYPPVQTVAAPSAVNQLTQQSQTMPATVEPVVPPTGPYQQPQLTQIN
ncbi:GBF-interacting protein 1 isoform X3 [Populus alba]|uniref:GBF-interacting protein 1 isoform X3 n=1 Tax=Populus alba TaxID=43335 RepID=UPI00158B91D0|nr:GBF-interacting protein 1-like isoform X3 [Populus alba]